MRLLVCVGELTALQERCHVLSERKLFDFGKEGLEGGRLRSCSLWWIPCGGGVGGQREGVSLIDAGVGVGAIDTVVKD